MGLDVMAVNGLKKVDAVFDNGGEPIDPTTREPIENYFQPYLNPDFPGRADELEHNGIYTFTDYESFWHGAYSRFNRWREQLAKLAGYPAVEVETYGAKNFEHAAAAWHGHIGPFFELINFSDCEGVIGAAVSAKLAKDFQEWDDRAKDVDESFYAGFTGFRRAFEMASKDGAVKFS